MPSLGKLWAGRLYGTNTGNLFLQLTEADRNLRGTLRIMDSVFGVAVYNVEGTFDDAVRLRGVPAQPAAPGVELGEIKGEGRLTEDGNLRGTWETTLGTGGTFELYPHDPSLPALRPGPNEPPEQIYAKNIALGALRLYGTEVRQLVGHIIQDFASARVVATYDVRGSQVTRYADDFLNDTSLENRAIDYLKLQAQEPDAHGINRLVVVEISANGVNEVRVQGVRESWVVGKAEAVASYLRQNQRTLVTTYKRFGLNLNSVIFLITIVLLPSVSSLRERAIFVGGVFVILQGLLAIHSQLVPNASIRLGDAEPGLFERLWPTVLSWLIGVTSSLAAALLYYWLVEQTP